MNSETLRSLLQYQGQENKLHILASKEAYIRVIPILELFQSPPPGCVGKEASKY
jgi:hypothetical protein